MTPSYIEDHISQLPALQMLIKMGYTYISPEEALQLREGRKTNVLLRDILKMQLQKINKIEYKGQTHDFSDTNVELAINELKELPMHLGFINANQHFYDLITLGKSFEQTIYGDRKSFLSNTSIGNIQKTILSTFPKNLPLPVLIVQTPIVQILCCSLMGFQW